MRKDVSRLDEALSALIEKEGFPGVAVAAWGPEGPIFEKGFGHRDAKGECPANPDTIFGIASMSKSMTALCCCLLAEEGRLRWDDPVCEYFPRFRVPGLPRQAVTLRHLATHTAGIPPMEPLEWSIACHTVRQDDWHRRLRENAPNPMDTIDQVIDYIAQCGYEPLGAPGEVESYCNEGYAILSYVVDMAAGVPLERFLRERVWGPLGMDRTVLDLDGSEARALSGGNITSLFEREDGKLTCDDEWSVLPPFRGCAQVRSTARDLAAYYRCLASRGRHEGRQVLPGHAVDMMIGSGFAVSRRPVYCLGLKKRLWKGHVLCEHAGGLHGTSSYGGLLLDEGMGFAVLCNEGDVSVERLLWMLTNHAMGFPPEENQCWQEKAAGPFLDPEMVTGAYRSMEGLPSVARLSLKDGRLYLEHEKNAGFPDYCGGTLFCLFGEDGRPRETAEALIRSRKAWGLRCGTRVYQRIEE